MFNIEIAGLVITIDNKYSYCKEKCEDYITDKDNNTGIVLDVSEQRMQDSIDYKFKFDGEVISFPEAEFDAVHYPIYQQLVNFDAFWLHSVLMEKDGAGYAFTAEPGVGKSTHAKLWLDTYKDAVIVNGDNAIIRRDDKDGIFYGYGTPFCGKEGINKKTRVPIKAICFLERSDTNWVEKMSPTAAVMRLRKDNWCILPGTVNEAIHIYLNLAQQVQFYCIHCNMEKDAAKVVYEAIKG